MNHTRFHTLRRTLPLALSASLLLAAGGAVAQDTDTERAGDNCVCFGGDGENAFGRVIMRTNRAMIGVVLGGSVDLDDGRGVRIDDVSDDGPARDAGLRAGDVITAINGMGLGTRPDQALVDALRDVEPGDAVEIAYERDGERRTVSVVTEERSAMSLWTGDQLRDRMGSFSVVTPRAHFRALMPAGLELVALNPGLGAYFGTDAGVLVTAVNGDTSLGLRPGDVILSIDGRDVRDPAHVRSILTSYRADEEITLQVVRQDRRTEVTGTLRD